MAGVRRGPLIDFFFCHLNGQLPTVEFIRLQIPDVFFWMTSSVMKHPLFPTGNTILRGKHASSEGHSRRNPWRRYSFNHRPSGHPARSYMLRWGHLLGTRSELQGWHSIREVPWMLYFLLHLPL